ncbi:hypothetical protein [Leptolyngbya sp. PCC 6406]|uniref:hypothetical protein n=1 Tax=Leptolyngbya sp. PCC 6406 TaxID=1173264 RepID=UPI0002AC13D8|nr:hypothetical protein [Leptolyngbya sp. PCC 6406]
MSKKNLSDLLREEAAATPAPDPTEASESSTEVSESVPATPARTSRRGPTKADLEQQVAELTTALAAAETGATELQTQVQALQGDLETQQGRLFELKESLEKAEQAVQAKDAQLTKVASELAEAKQVIVRMTETPAAPPPPAPVPAVTPAPSSAPSERAPLTVRMPSVSRRAMAKGIPEYAIQRGEPTKSQNSMLSDDDIGWVD